MNTKTTPDPVALAGEIIEFTKSRSDNSVIRAQIALCIAFVLLDDNIDDGISTLDFVEVVKQNVAAALSKE